MTLKWYEEHMEKVVKENEALRFICKKNNDGLIVENLTALFKELFPQLPALTMVKSQTRNPNDVLEYYKTVGKKWIEMVKTKLDVLEENLTLEQKEDKKEQHCSEEHSNQRSSISLSRIKQKELCLLCGNPKEHSVYEKLKKKIEKLQRAIGQLKNDINYFEREEQKYLKEISYLRSITKKLEFQLEVNFLTHKKVQNAYVVKEKEYELDIVTLQKQAQMWREEYDRIWQQQMKKVQFSGQSSEFQEERVLLNTFYKEEPMESSGSHSQFWIIRGDSVDHSEVEEKKDDIPSLPSTSRQ